MKKLWVSTAVATMLACGFVAAAADHTQPGTPGTPNCHGQTAAFLAQAAANGDADPAFHGIGGVGRFLDMSVAEIQALINEYCAGDVGTE